MTFKQKLMQEHPELVDKFDENNGGCPYDYGFEQPFPCENPTCEQCWNREMPGTQEDKSDAVNHPSHYTQGGIECIDALEAATEGLTGIEAVCTANAIKYLWRWKRKNGVEDLQKAHWYIQHLVHYIESRR